MPAFRKDLSSIAVYTPGKPLDEVMREYGVTDIAKMASDHLPIWSDILVPAELSTC